MESIYSNILILFILIGIVILIHYRTRDNRLEYFVLTQSPNTFAPIPYIHKPLLNHFSSQPSAYDTGTRSYYNPFFDLEVAQGLDTN